MAKVNKASIPPKPKTTDPQFSEANGAIIRADETDAPSDWYFKLDNRRTVNGIAVNRTPVSPLKRFKGE